MNFNILVIIILYITLLFASAYNTNYKENDEVKISILLIDSICIDGNDDEWELLAWNRLYADNLGEPTDSNDLSAYFKLAWNDEGLCFLVKIFDNKIYSDTLKPWESDNLELFISPYRGSDDIVQFTFLPEVNGLKNPYLLVNDYRKSPEIRPHPISTGASLSMNDSAYLIEGLIDIKFLGKTVNLNTHLALQIKLGDADHKRQKDKNFLYWHPLGHSYQNSYAMFRVQFSEKDYQIPRGTSRLIIKDDDSISLMVFGSDKKRLILKTEQHLLLDTLFNPVVSDKTIKLDLDHSKINPEEDSLYVYLNDELINLHEIFLSPRLYDKLEKPAFEREIRTFLFMDRMNPPPQEAVLFIGSSSISRWYSLQEDFPEYKIIQRGFGGSSTEDVLAYMNKIVLPYRPAKIFYYEGDNDIKRGHSTREIVENIKSFVSEVNSQLPKTELYLISPKISVGRLKYHMNYLTLQSEMKQLSSENEQVHYIDVSSEMININGEVNNSLFDADGVHLNEKGYALWKSVIKSALTQSSK